MVIAFRKSKIVKYILMKVFVVNAKIIMLSKKIIELFVSKKIILVIILLRITVKAIILVKMKLVIVLNVIMIKFKKRQNATYVNLIIFCWKVMEYAYRMKH